MKLRLKHLLTLVFLAAIVAAAVYAFRPQPVVVDLSTVDHGQLTVTVDEDGRTRIKERYIVSTPLAGRLTRINLDAGDSVYGGETIVARLEPTDPVLLDPRARAQTRARVQASAARVQQAEADLKKAEAAREFAEAELDRAEQLTQRGASGTSKLEQARFTARARAEEERAAQFAAEIARFELELEQAALTRTATDADADPEESSAAWFFEIRAPISGRVLRVFQESATVVPVGAQLLELGDPADLEVVVDVLSSDAVKIARGAAVTLERWGGDSPLPGTVRLVEPSGFTRVSALGVEEQRVNVIIDFDAVPAKPNSLGDGFRVEARIVIWDQADALLLPVGALFREQNAWAVFHVVDGQARLQAVEIGRRNGTFAEVLSGLDRGAQVIVHPSDQITDGVPVLAR